MDEQESIAELFKLIENNKAALNLEAYSLSQATLEQVFLKFAREQKGLDQNSEEDEQKSSIVNKIYQRVKNLRKKKDEYRI